jgi:hypothetical protein
MTQAFNLSQFANKVNTSGQASLTTAVSGTLPVANGGTNQTTYTDGQLLIGNTTGNTLTKATLTAGSGVTITNGSGAITIAAAGGGFTNMTVFASPGTFTTPATTTKIKVTVIGGGGGGTPFNAPAGRTAGGGGGGGGAIYVGPVSASTPYPVTVGSGGAVNVNAAGNPGGTSSFSTLASATGGTGASNSNTTGGAGSAGTLQINGNPSTGNGNGGSSAFGFGASNLLVPLTTGATGFLYGGGGAGANPSSQNSGPGGAGVVIVEF